MLVPLYEIFKLNSKLYLNCLDGMDEDQARWRPNAQTNSAAFVALHLLDSRYFVARTMGIEHVSPFAAMTEGKRTIEEMDDMPTLEQLRGAWREITGEIRERFKTTSAEALTRDIDTKLPLDNKTLLGVLSFLFQHDSFHLGQLALLRKQVGLQAMSYR